MNIIKDASEKVKEISGYEWVKRTALEKSKTAITWSVRVVLRASVPLRRISAMFGRSSGSTGHPSDACPVASQTTPPPSPEPGTGVSAARVRFMSLVRSAVMVNRLIAIGDEAKAKVSRSSTDGKATEPEIATMPSSRVVDLVPRLQSMVPAQDIAAHTALVRHMQVSTKPVVTFVPTFNRLRQFSPDGKFLATSSWDHTSVIFRVGVCLVDVSLRRITERLFRNNSLPVRYCCTPLDSPAKLHGESYCFGNTRHE